MLFDAFLSLPWEEGFWCFLTGAGHADHASSNGAGLLVIWGGVASSLSQVLSVVSGNI